MCVDQVESGVDIAINKFVDYKLEEVLKKGNVLTVVAAAAVTMNPGISLKFLQETIMLAHLQPMAQMVSISLKLLQEKARLTHLQPTMQERNQTQVR